MPTRPSPPPSSGAPVTDPKLGFGAWVVLPTYDEAENIGPVSEAILGALPGATLLVVDDNSPDGTGRLADELAESDARVRVRHRKAKQGLGRAYLDGFTTALDGGAGVVIQMDADFSHDPAVLPSLIAPIVDGQADLVIGSRYVAGWRHGRLGHRPAGHLARRQHLRADAPAARAARSDRRLQGVARRDTRRGPVRRHPRRRLRVPDRDDVPRQPRRSARPEVPIVFHDRRIGQSKMSRRILVEALFIVVGLWWEELRGRFRRRPAGERSGE